MRSSPSPLRLPNQGRWVDGRAIQLRCVEDHLRFDDAIIDKLSPKSRRNKASNLAGPRFRRVLVDKDIEPSIAPARPLAHHMALPLAKPAWTSMSKSLSPKPSPRGT